MTPLAHKIANELTQPVKRRTFNDRAGLLKRFDDIHCFECSAVNSAARDLAADMLRRGSVSRTLAFLPAPKTWIEWAEPSGRLAVLIEQSLGDPDLAFVTVALDAAGKFISTDGGVLRLREDARTNGGFLSVLESRDDKIATAILYAFLAMINTPRIIGRTAHMPHAGLQRRLAKAHGMIGKFPLHAWTEIKLEVRPPKISEGDQEIRLSGRKALHFVRCHLRIRRGQLELVSSHWRGDASLGIKQSRYKLVA